MSEIKPGYYNGKIVKYGIGKTQSGNPQAMIQFQFQTPDGQSHTLTWYGSFSEKAKKFTIDALLRCGLRVDNISILANGVESGALDTEKELSLDIRKEKGDDGKERLKIAWVNEIGSSAFKNIIPQVEAMSLLQGLEADVAMRRAETGIKKSDDDLGF